MPDEPDTRGLLDEDPAPANSAAGSVLVLLARDPHARSNGRQAVLCTAVRALKDYGANVHIIAVTERPGPTQWEGCSLARVSPPALPSVIAQAVLSFVTKSSFNECLFGSRRIRQAVEAAAAELDPVAVLVDTIRLWPASRRLRTRSIVHLDDLLSDRYEKESRSPGRPEVLGYYGRYLPGWVRRGVSGLAPVILAVEARRLAKREVQVARTATATALTGATEASELTRRSGRAVYALPMSVESRRPAGETTSATDRIHLVFLGGLDYGPNADALTWWRDNVIDELERLGLRAVLSVIGFAPEELQGGFPPAHFRFEGYVGSLEQAIPAGSIFVAPMLSKGGVKTKVLDAMSLGLPIVATPAAVDGIPCQEGRHMLVADTGSAFAIAVSKLAGDPERAGLLTRSAQQLLEENFSYAAISRRWFGLLDDVVPSSRP